MPNWCYNKIEITGSPENISRIRNVIKDLKKSKDEQKQDGLFKALIGLPADTDMKEYENGGWYDTNVEWFGTKWDVSVDFVQAMYQSYILLAGETAWSPPINFGKVLAETYGVQVSMYYEEPGNNFCGKCIIDADGTCGMEDYEYQEGIYYLEGFEEWYEREFVDWMVYDYKDEDESNLTQVILSKFGFLSDKELEQCADTLNKEIKLLKSKEQ